MTARRKRIFVLTHNYPRDEHDMSGIFIKNIINDLREDFDFDVCPIRFGSTMHKLYKNPLKWPALAGFYRRALAEAERGLAGNRYDLIWAHWWLPPGLIAARLARKTGHPLMVTCHGTDAFMLRDLPILRPFANYVFRTAKMVNVVSHYMASITTNRAVVANMPYNQEIFNYHGEKKDDNYLVCPSAFIKRKNLDILIRAVKNLPEIKLKIFGSGILQQELEAEARGLTNIEISPPLAQTQLAEEYKRAGAVILPSVGEGFGLTLPEGAACGCFPLATYDGGMVEIVQNLGGINFPHDPSGKEIEAALKKYLSMLPVDRQAIAEKAKIYSREQIIPRFQAMLNSILPKGS